MKSANSFNYSSRKFTCNGPFMITTLVYTDKFTEKYLAMRNHDREAYLKKKKQEAEEKAREVAENGETHEKRENQKR